MRRRASTVALLAGALGVVGLVAGLGPSGAGSDDADPSSRSAGRSGTLALFSWLHDLGLDTTRLRGSWSLGDVDVLVVVAPRDEFSDAEAAETRRFVAAGGELVLALDAQGSRAAARLLDRLGAGTEGAVVGGGMAVPAQPLDPGDSVRRVPMEPEAAALSGDGAPLLRLHGATVAVGLGVGAGRAYVVGSAYPLENEGLRVTRPDASGVLRPTGTDSDRLVLAMLERAQSVAHPLRVAFDEVHHGEGQSGGLAAILISPAGLAALLAALVVLGFLATSGRRLGRAVPAGDVTRVPTAAEFVGAMAMLYERSARRGSIARRYADELKARVGAATGVEPHVEDAAFVAALEPWGGALAAEVAGALAAARTLEAGRPTDAEIVALAARLDAVESRWTAGAPV